MVDVRIVSATHRDLIADVKAGRFREDLFYRLHVFPVTVPPLRRRPEDVAPLTRHFLARFAAEEGKRVRAISAEAMGLLAGFRWPGNVRQLENAVFRAVVLAESDEVGVADFPQIAALAQRQPGSSPTMVAPAIAPLPLEALESVAPPLVQDIHSPMGSIAPQQSEPGVTLPLLDGQGEVRPLEELEAEVIRFAISHYRGQMSEVARRLQIGRSTLYRKLDALGLAQRLTENDTDPVVAG
jgi:DNA-binding NtrC family response regulator